jgi:hypothetical protein
MRDSLVYDLMEPVRPKIDAYVLDWITRAPLKRVVVFRTAQRNLSPDGTVALQLTETTWTWGREVAPYAEWFAHVLCSTTSMTIAWAHRKHVCLSADRMKGKAQAYLNLKKAPKPRLLYLRRCYIPEKTILLRMCERGSQSQGPSCCAYS